MSEQMRFLCLAAVIEKTGLSKTSIYGISDFPKAIKIRGAGASPQSGSRWVDVEITNWMQSRIQLRDAQRGSVKIEGISR